MSHQQIGIHRDLVELITSQEADDVTPLMSKIYYRLLTTPPEWWESNEAIRVKVSTQNAASTTAMAELINWLRVPPEQANKALQWLSKKNVVTYFIHPSGREIEITFEGLYFPE